MAEKKEELVYTDSTAKRDLDARLNNPDPVRVAPHKDYVNPDKSVALATDYEGDEVEGVFVGVSPEYANAANDTDAPLQAEEGPDADAESAFEDSFGDSSGKPSEAVLDAREDVAPHRPEVEAPVPSAQSSSSVTEASSDSSASGATGSSTSNAGE